MAFIRSRFSSRSGRSGEYEWYSYQVIETYREGGKIKQRVLCNLGTFRNLGPHTTIAAMLQQWDESSNFIGEESWPPQYLVRRYGKAIPAPILEGARREREERKRAQADRRHRFHEMQRLYGL